MVFPPATLRQEIKPAFHKAWFWLANFLIMSGPSSNNPSAPGEPDITAQIASEILAWRYRVQSARPAIDRYMCTEEFALTTAHECGTADADIMSAAVEDFVIIPCFGVIQNSDATLLLRPALVVGTFDPRVEAIMHAAALADYMGSLYGGDPPTDAEVKALWDIVHDDEYAPGKRHLIPEPTAGGFQIYVFSVLLVGKDPGGEEAGIIGFLTSPPPGPGVLIHIPARVLAGMRHEPLEIPGLKRTTGRRTSSGESARRGRSGGGKGILHTLWFRILAGLFVVGILAGLLSGPRSGEKRQDKAGEKPREIKRQPPAEHKTPAP